MKLVLILHNIRSTHNAGSLLRSADGFGIEKIYFTGYTPYPKKENDERLPHLAAKIDNQIHKTALGSENTVAWEQNTAVEDVINHLRKVGFVIAALEQTKESQNLSEYTPSKNLAMILGNEVEGLDKEALSLADIHLEIPMKGKKESLNVAIAGSIAMYHLTINSL